MATGVLMPKQGITVESCVITEWVKNVGDQVAVGDILFNYETDKASFECESTAAGVLLAKFFEDGDEVPVLVNACAIGEPGEDFSALAPESAADGGGSEPAAKAAEAPAEPASAFQAAQTPPELTAAPAAGGEYKISPRARAAAERLGVDPATAVPSGPAGRIIERDLAGAMAYTKAAAATGATQGELALGGRIGLSEPGKAPTFGAAKKPSAVPADPMACTEEKMSGVRRSISKAMMNSLSSMAQLTHHFSFDATEVLRLRASWKKNAEALNIPNVTLNDIILYAVSRVALQFPACNAHLNGDSIKLFSHCNVGMAVDTERGLLVPTIFAADCKSLFEISAEAKTLAKAAQGGSISPDSLTGGTITVSNLGGLGVELFTPIINPPQTCIIGVCNIQTKVRLVGGQPEYYQAMGLSLTYDHRAVDGAPASRFMQTLCTALENFTAYFADFS